jgi:hypothetical protein
MPVKYRHYKGGIYELVCEATLEADLTPLIIYRASDGAIWCRPKSVFFEIVEAGGARVPRFAVFDESAVSRPFGDSSHLEPT